jgi:hypothetical protein
VSTSTPRARRPESRRGVTPTRPAHGEVVTSDVFGNRHVVEVRQRHDGGTLVVLTRRRRPRSSLRHVLPVRSRISCGEDLGPSRSTHSHRSGSAWPGLPWPALACPGLVRLGLARPGPARPGSARPGQPHGRPVDAPDRVVSGRCRPLGGLRRLDGAVDAGGGVDTALGRPELTGIPIPSRHPGGGSEIAILTGSRYETGRRSRRAATGRREGSPNPPGLEGAVMAGSRPRGRSGRAGGSAPAPDAPVSARARVRERNRQLDVMR